MPWQVETPAEPGWGEQNPFKGFFDPGFFDPVAFFDPGPVNPWLASDPASEVWGVA